MRIEMQKLLLCERKASARSRVHLCTYVATGVHCNDSAVNVPSITLPEGLHLTSSHMNPCIFACFRPVRLSVGNSALI